MKVYKNKTFDGYEPRITITEEFVKRNNLSINEDAARNVVKNPEDILRFSASVAIDYL